MWAFLLSLLLHRMGWPEFLEHFAELTVCRLQALDSTHLEARQQGWLASAFGAGEAVKRCTPGRQYFPWVFPLCIFP